MCTGCFFPFISFYTVADLDMVSSSTPHIMRTPTLENPRAWTERSLHLPYPTNDLGQRRRPKSSSSSRIHGCFTTYDVVHLRTPSGEQHGAQHTCAGRWAARHRSTEILILVEKNRLHSFALTLIRCHNTLLDIGHNNIPLLARYHPSVNRLSPDNPFIS